MPRFPLIPKKTGAHRLASIALYRALLEQCHAAPLSESQRQSLYNIIKNRFQKNAALQSPELLKAAFDTGYKTLDLLDASVAGDLRSTSSILSLIAKAPHHLSRSSHLRRKPAPKDWFIACGSPPLSILTERPRANVSGTRHVPVLFLANGLPILRIKKPQPRNLSRYIRQVCKYRQKCTDMRHHLEKYLLPLAHEEDRWDALVIQFCGQSAESQHHNSSWEDEIKRSAAENLDRYEQFRQKVSAVAERMYKIVDQEKALVDQEQLDRMAKRKAEKLERRAARRREEMERAIGSD